MWGLAASSTASAVSALRWNWPWGPWVTLPAVSVAAAYILYVYAKESRHVSRQARMGLACLRLAALALVVLMLGRPVLETRRAAPPKLALLLDASASMSTRDVKAGDLPGARKATDMISRTEAWQSILRAGSLWKDLQARYQVEPIQFGSRIERLQSLPKLATTAAPGGEASKMENGSQTRLGDAIDYAARGAGAQPPTAVVMMTDGVNTAGLSLAEAAERAAGTGTALFAVAIGNDKPPADLSLENMVMEEVAFPGDRLEVEATVKAHGLAGRTAKVMLHQMPGAAVLVESALRLPADDERQTVRLPFRAEKPGKMRLELAVEPQVGERDTKNNRLEASVDVRKDPIEVLLVASEPSFEYRALKSLLQRDPAISLRTLLQDADPDFPLVDAAAVDRFPSSLEQLLKFDVVMLAAPDTERIEAQEWENLRKFVSDHGGGLVLIAAGDFGRRKLWRSTVLQHLAPVSRDFDAAGAPPRLGPRTLIRPTAAGLEDSSVQLGEAREDSAFIWEQLPPVADIQPSRPKPGAQVLAEAVMADAAAVDSVPAILRQYVGAGEVLFHATDETWRWRWRNDDRFFARYWGQSVRRLARGRYSRGVGELSTDRTMYELGEPITVRGRIRPTDLFHAEELSVELEGDSVPTREVRLKRMANEKSDFETVLHDLRADHYTARLIAPTERRAVLTTQFEVKPPLAEMTQLLANVRGLREAAEMTGGKLYTMRTIGRLLNDLPRVQRTTIEQLPDRPLWNSPWVLAALFGILTTEWFWRRRQGLL